MLMVHPVPGLLRQSPKACVAAFNAEQSQSVGAAWEMEVDVKGCHRATDPCPSHHKPPLLRLQLEQKRGWPFPGPCREGATHLHLPWTGLMPQHHAGGAVLAERPHWPPRCPLPFAFPWKQKLFRECSVSCWRSQGSWKSSSQDPRCHLGASFGRAGLGPVSPWGERNGELSPLSALTQRSSILHHPAEPRTPERAGGSGSWAECPGAPACSWGRNPNAAQTLGGRGTPASLFQKPPQPAWREKPNQSPWAKATAASASASVQPLVFFFKWRFL